MTVSDPIPAACSGRGWVLPEDGIVDPIAIEIAATGARRVALTPTERLLATARILAAGGTTTDIAARLHISGTTARALAHQARTLASSHDVQVA